VHEALPRLRKELRQGLEDLQGYGRRDNDRMFAQICTWQDQALNRVNEPEAASSVAVEQPSIEAAQVEQQADVDSEPTLPAEVQAMIERLGDIEFDTWFEFTDADTGRHHRYKLAWYSKISSNYMFVDAMGVKAAEFTRAVLAEKLCSGTAHILEQHDKPFLDRALSTILTWLGRSKTVAAT
jgi:hypothetical protein